jgi:AraC-like DNA-binding protein
MGGMAGGSAFPSLRFSTADLPEKDRLPFWREVFGRSVLKIDIEPLTDAPFVAAVVLTSLPDLNFAYGSAPGSNQYRTRVRLADGNDALCFPILLGGTSVVRQFGRETALSQGETSLMSCSDIGSLVNPGEARYLSFAIPRHLLKWKVPNIEDRCGELIPRANPALRLLTNYVEGWQHGELATTPELCRTFSGHVNDLIALMFGARGEVAAMAAQGGGRAARLALIRREIDNGFAAPDFSLATLVRRVGTSPRSVQRLLAEQDSSFIDEVNNRRLQQAFYLLQSPRCKHLSIIDIACECGFVTTAHFHRRFRRRYDATPGDVRAGQARKTDV